MEDFNQFGEPVQNVNPGQNTNQSQNGNYMQGMNPGQYGNYAQGMYQANGTGNNQFSQKKKKNAGFGKGLGLGVLLGGTVAILGGFLMIKGYAGLTGQYVVIGNSGSVSAVSDSAILDAETVEKINELTQYMDVYYYDDYDKDEVRDSIYEGLVAGLGDKYSVYYDEEAFNEFQVSTTGDYYGIGAGLSQNADTMVVTISKVYEGTPSEEAGLKKDDIILTVDGVEATSMEVSELVKLIRGEEGTFVTLEIYRESTGETLTFEVERRNIQLPSVTAEMLEGDIGYIQISEFQTNTASQFEDYRTELESQGMKGLIVDLRANPGGLLTSVTDILDQLLPEGTLVYTEDKYGNRQTYTSEEGCVDYPIVLLQDENSASASEIFAGAIKDYNYGTIVGTNSFGKGIVQTYFELSDHDAIKITTAKYFTPNGNYIHEVGIAPDVEVEYEYSGPTDGEYDKQYDSQFQKAYEIMQGKLAEDGEE